MKVSSLCDGPTWMWLDHDIHQLVTSNISMPVCISGQNDKHKSTLLDPWLYIGNYSPCASLWLSNITTWNWIRFYYLESRWNIVDSGWVAVLPPLRVVRYTDVLTQNPTVTVSNKAAPSNVDCMSTVVWRGARGSPRLIFCFVTTVWEMTRINDYQFQAHKCPLYVGKTQEMHFSITFMVSVIHVPHEFTKSESDTTDRNLF